MVKKIKESEVSRLTVPNISSPNLSKAIPKITKLLKKKIVKNLAIRLLPFREKIQASSKATNGPQLVTGINILLNINILICNNSTN